MTNSRRKGKDSENAVARWLQANGWPHAERRGPGFEASDLIGVGPISIEIKNQKAIRLNDWFTQMLEQQAEDRAEHGLLIIKRAGHVNPGDWYCVTTLNQQAGLLRACGYGEPI